MRWPLSPSCAHSSCKCRVKSLIGESCSCSDSPAVIKIPDKAPAKTSNHSDLHTGIFSV